MKNIGIRTELQYKKFYRKGKKMEECKVCNLYNLEETIAKELLESIAYPWEHPVSSRLVLFIIIF